MRAERVNAFALGVLVGLAAMLITIWRYPDGLSFVMLATVGVSTALLLSIGVAMVGPYVQALSRRRR